MVGGWTLQPINRLTFNVSRPNTRSTRTPYIVFIKDDYTIMFIIGVQEQLELDVPPTATCYFVFSASYTRNIVRSFAFCLPLSETPHACGMLL